MYEFINATELNMFKGHGLIKCEKQVKPKFWSSVFPSLAFMTADENDSRAFYRSGFLNEKRGAGNYWNCLSQLYFIIDIRLTTVGSGGRGLVHRQRSFPPKTFAARSFEYRC